MSKKYELSRRKALAALGTIGVAGAGAGLGTSALYSDSETFSNNTITAGTTNLIVEAKVAAKGQGLRNSNGDVIIEATDDQGDSDAEVDGDAEIGITATDIKPGDKFVVGFNVIVQDNPMYVAAQASNLNDSENTPNTEPENAAQNAGTNPDTGGDAVGGSSAAGDLDNQMDTVLGYDGTANNFTWDQSSAVAPNNAEAGTSGGQSLTTFLDNLANVGFLYRDVDSQSGTPIGHGNGNPTELGNGNNVTHWQYFEVPIGVGNEVQGDSVSWDVTWYGEQVRNNAAPTGPSDVIDGSP